MTDCLEASLSAIIRGETYGNAFYRFYEGSVVAQSGQKVDVNLSSDVMPNMVGIPLRVGTSGLSINVLPGAKVLVGFYDGRPDKPFATHFDTDSLASLILDASVSLKLHAQSVELGNSTARNLAHAQEVVTALTAITTGFSAMLAAAASNAAGPQAGVPATNAQIAAIFSPLTTAITGITSVLTTLPTVNTRAS